MSRLEAIDLLAALKETIGDGVRGLAMVLSHDDQKALRSLTASEPIPPVRPSLPPLR